jgi:hypothetical protein
MEPPFEQEIGFMALFFVPPDLNSKHLLLPNANPLL